MRNISDPGAGRQGGATGCLCFLLILLSLFTQIRERGSSLGRAVLHHPCTQCLGDSRERPPRPHPAGRAGVPTAGLGGVKDRTLHVIPDFRGTKGHAMPCLPCTPSPGALKHPLGWILRLRPGAGSRPLAPASDGREESCASQKLLLCFRPGPEQQR